MNRRFTIASAAAALLLFSTTLRYAAWATSEQRMETDPAPHRHLPEWYQQVTRGDPYRQEALAVTLDEANRVAKALGLDEKQPITLDDVKEVYICPEYDAREQDGIANIHTANYGYYISRTNKLCYVDGLNHRADLRGYIERYKWPVSKVDTKAAYHTATQWLGAIEVDVARLTRECRVQIDYCSLGDADWAKGSNQMQSRFFTPVYYLSWYRRSHNSQGAAASVIFCAPSGTLMQLRVDYAPYLGGRAVQMTNVVPLFMEPSERGQAVRQLVTLKRVIDDFPAERAEPALRAHEEALHRLCDGSATLTTAQREHGVEIADNELEAKMRAILADRWPLWEFVRDNPPGRTTPKATPPAFRVQKQKPKQRTIR